MLQDLLRQLLDLSWIDWSATLLALVYVILAARQRAIAWIFGIVSCSLWAYASFFFYQLYLDALLQLFYVGMGFWGWFSWRKNKTSGGNLSIATLPWQQHLWIITAGTLIGLLFGYFFAAWTPAAATYPDALTTIFALFATLMQVRKILENWLYWIVIDAAYAWLYGSRGAWLFMLLMVVYVAIATIAWWQWQKTYRNNLIKH
ncbi:MAG: nicotinamide riboside transporter PnuC [Saprospiraceae bacterium]|jgi:nicotinamide mononucleotide transporter|nr:nicotinamide riboside transporter PnuC [Saprospiraceae bacterium]MDP4820002.1 nicotinamide riboside transporter PnuC [Saprospiraceae bacterium]MDP4998452.1 nicotinamide riboside transporter PnuC [Saprospiraceae bacterium]